MAPFLRAAEKQSDYTRGKSVVLLVLVGGPPQIETFDPKMDAPVDVRSLTGSVPTSLPGVHFGATFPKLARRARQLAVVRSFGAGRGGLSHEAGYERLLTGGNTLDTPSMGALFARIAGNLHPKTSVPRHAILQPESIDPALELGHPSGAFTHRQTMRYFAGGGPLGASVAAFDPGGGGNLLDDMQLNVSKGRFVDRRHLLDQVDGLKRRLESATRTASELQLAAHDVLLTGMTEAFDLQREDPEILARYDTRSMVPLSKIRRGGAWYHNNFNRTTNLLGCQMLMARRLCEAGCGFVTVLDQCWDFHADGNNAPIKRGMDALSPQADHAISAFLDDVKTRGLSDDILLVVTAEMGRNTRKSSKGGSGHWGNLTPLILAGGGLKMGQVIGASDAQGMEPVTRSYGPEHLHATVMHTLLDLPAIRTALDLPADLAAQLTRHEPIAELV